MTGHEGPLGCLGGLGRGRASTSLALVGLGDGRRHGSFCSFVHSVLVALGHSRTPCEGEGGHACRWVFHQNQKPPSWESCVLRHTGLLSSDRKSPGPLRASSEQEPRLEPCLCLAVGRRQLKSVVGQPNAAIACWGHGGRAAGVFGLALKHIAPHRSISAKNTWEGDRQHQRATTPNGADGNGPCMAATLCSLSFLRGWAFARQEGAHPSRT